MHLKSFVTTPKDYIQNEYKSKGVDACGYCQENLELFDIFGPKFNDKEFLSDNYICKDCIILFSDYFRKKSFYITKDKSELLSQNQIADVLRNIELPCILSFTESYKKHRLFKSQINYDKNNFAIQCDNYRVYLDLDKDIALMNFLETIYNKYELNKEWLLTGEIPAIKIIDMQNDYIEYKKLTKNLLNTNKLIVLVKFINDTIDRNKKSKK